MQVLKRVKNNAYQLDLPYEYGVHTTFNVTDLIPFAGNTNDESNSLNLRTNPLQDGGDDDRAPCRGPSTRSMARRIQDKWNSTKRSREKFLSTSSMT